jgi:DNA-binding IclR family transcriptional regulator
MSTDGESTWTFLTNHTQVLLCLARDPEMRLRDVADTVGITERATQRILADLVEAGYVERRRLGRRNHYKINRDHAMRHVAQLGYQIGGLLDLLERGRDATRLNRFAPVPRQDRGGLTGSERA